MSRSMLIATVAFAAAALVPQAPVFAKHGERQDSAYTADSAIYVEAPRVGVITQPGARGVRQSPVLISQVEVYSGDLDLRTEFGRAALNDRVLDAAHRICERLDQLDPPSGLSSDGAADCVHQTVRRAQFQVRARIFSA